MTRNGACARKARTVLLGFMFLACGSVQARAQYGMGMGWGWGLGMRNVPSPSEFINQHALSRTSGPPSVRPGLSPYANNPNSYINRLRDPGFTSHYDVGRRAAPNYQRARARRTEPGPAAETPAPYVPPALANFFNAAQRLVWPDEAPIQGDLKEKRDVSDQASLAVLEETRRQSMASLSSATYAREKLIVYGQPALKAIREQSTPVIADTFHNFLLSLYESLAQAASPPADAGPAPKP